MHFNNNIDRYTLGKHGYYFESNGSMIFRESWEHPQQMYQQKEDLITLMIQSYKIFLLLNINTNQIT